MQPSIEDIELIMKLLYTMKSILRYKKLNKMKSNEEHMGIYVLVSYCLEADEHRVSS